MAAHSHRTVERETDVLIIGGSAAGLGAALQIARQDRSVLVVDAGDPRNAPAVHMHGYVGYDGAPPSDLTAIGRDEVRRYGGEILAGRVTAVHAASGGGFRAETTGGHAVRSRRVLVATGIVDDLPAIPGVAERWGDTVIHCPFCHGYEARGRRIVHLVDHPMGLHPASLFAHLAGHLTLVVRPDLDLDDHSAAELAALAAAGVVIERTTAAAIVGAPDGARIGAPDEPVVAGTDVAPGGGALLVRLAGGADVPADVVVVGPRFRARLDAVAPLGLESVAHPSGIGWHLPVDARHETAVPGVYAAGNVTDPSQQVLHAAADGTRAGAMVAFDLAAEDLRIGDGAAANERDWDRRYDGEPVWSGNPNGTLVGVVGDMAPGRALDVGAGEGGDAIWLAQQGWTVTAADVSTNALDHVERAARHAGVEVTTRHADARTSGALGDEGFDLVSAQYASIPRTPEGTGVENLLAAVAPGGHLLVVGHDLAPMRTPVDTAVATRMFDPDAYVRVDDVAAALAGRDGWEVLVHDLRPRPAGAASGHHVDDVVLLARRAPRR